jgi:hypothetical protein
MSGKKARRLEGQEKVNFRGALRTGQRHQGSGSAAGERCQPTGNNVARRGCFATRNGCDLRASRCGQNPRGRRWRQRGRPSGPQLCSSHQCDSSHQCESSWSRGRYYFSPVERRERELAGSRTNDGSFLRLPKRNKEPSSRWCVFS